MALFDPVVKLAEHTVLIEERLFEIRRTNDGFDLYEGPKHVGSHRGHAGGVTYAAAEGVPSEVPLYSRAMEAWLAAPRRARYRLSARRNLVGGNTQVIPDRLFDDIDESKAETRALAAQGYDVHLDRVEDDDPRTATPVDWTK